jgi:hypothetical protein
MSVITPYVAVFWRRSPTVFKKSASFGEKSPIDGGLSDKAGLGCGRGFEISARKSREWWSFYTNSKTDRESVGVETPEYIACRVPGDKSPGW